MGLGGRVQVGRVGIGYPLFRDGVRVRQVFQVFMYCQEAAEQLFGLFRIKVAQH